MLGGDPKKTCLQVCLLNDTRINIFRLVKIGSEKNSQSFCISVCGKGDTILSFLEDGLFPLIGRFGFVVEIPADSRNF